MASHVATTAPLFSASVLDSAIVDCFLLLHAVGDEAVNVEDRRTFCVMKKLPIRVSKIRTQREREIGTKRRFIPKGNSYRMTTTLTNGYKVTL